MIEGAKALQSYSCRLIKSQSDATALKALSQGLHDKKQIKISKNELDRRI